jgi:protein-disulfide isomerase
LELTKNYKILNFMPKQNQEVNKSNAVVGVIVFIIIIAIAGYFINKSLNKVHYDAPEVERPFLGNQTAEKVLTEYSDFACPACKSASSKVKDLVEKYGNKLKIEYRHYPLVSIHSNAFAAAVAAECANDQGKFWEYHDELFAVNDNNSFIDDNLKSYAEKVGLDTNLWQACVDSKERTKVVRDDSRKARTFGFNGTPSFVFNGSPVKDWSKLDQMLEIELGGYLDKDN